MYPHNNAENQPKQVRPSAQAAELKVPDVDFPSPTDSHINFQVEASRLAQANTIIA